MVEAAPKYDAVLIHALGDKETGRLSIRSRLVIRAAVELNNQGGVGMFIVSGPKFKGNLPIGLAIKEELVRRHHIAEKRIISTTDRPMTTSEELGFLREQIDSHPEWKSIVHVSLVAHSLSMLALKRLLKSNGKTVEFKTAEGVLSHRYRNFFSKLHLTPDEFKWRIYEAVKFPFLLFPPTEKLLNKIATRCRPQVTRL